MLEDVPVIPVTEGVAWYEWTTRGFAGWPSPADQYAAPGAVERTRLGGSSSSTSTRPS